MVEQGKGFAEAGDYAPGSDGELYEILSVGPRIETGRPGAANRIEGCTVRLADWNDCAEEDVAIVLLRLEGNDE